MKRLALLVAALLTVGVAAAPAASAYYVTGSGFSLFDAHTVGSPYHTHIWVDPYTTRRPSVLVYLQNAAAAMRSYGLDIVVVAVSAPGDVEGRITVRSGTCNAHEGGFAALSEEVETPSGNLWVAHADVTICGAAYASDPLLNAVVLHELGHSVGIDHYPYRYAGVYQVMSPSAQPQDSQYEPGDVNGIRWLAAHRQPL